MPNQPPSSWLYGNQSLPIMSQGGIDPRMMSFLAYIYASRMEGGEGQPPQSTEPEAPINPYNAQPFRPMPTGLSPLGRFNDMALRQSAALADRLKEGKDAVSASLKDSNDRQSIVDAITHPPPAMPYSITSAADQGTGEQSFPNGAPMQLRSRYGTGSVSFAPPGTEVHGRFGPEGLQFGQIGGKDEAQPTSGDPMQTTYQQQMMLDSIHKALGKKPKS